MFRCFFFWHLVAAAALLAGCARGEATKDKVPAPQVTQAEPGKTSPEAAAKTSKKPSRAPKSDEEAILGSWHTVRYEIQGEEKPNDEPNKSMFTKKYYWMDSMQLVYTLETDKAPKQLTCGFEGGPKNLDMPGIYRLDGDSLIICLAMSDRTPRPTDFTTTKGDDRILIEYKRLQSLSPETPDAEFDPELRQAILEAIRLLETGDVKGFVGQFGPAGLPEDKMQEAVQYLTPQRDAFATTLRTVLKIKPDIDQSTAIFDLSNVHIEGGVPFPRAKWVKVDGRWRIKDR